MPETTPHDAYVALVLKTADEPTLREIRLQAMHDQRLTLKQISEIVLRINRKLGLNVVTLVLNQDQVQCPQCKLPWALHPQNIAGETFCISVPVVRV